MTGQSPAESFEEAAAAVARVVVLLRAGLDIDRAVEHLGAGPGVFGGVSVGNPVSVVIASLLEMCRLAGSPVASALDREAIVLTDLGLAARDVEIAAAGPLATARIVGALPAAGLLLTLFLGFDVVGAVTGSILGTVTAVSGVALTIAGGLWSRRIVRAARPVFAEPGLFHELVSVGLGGGLGAEAALELSTRIVSDLAPTSDGFDEAIDDIERLIALGRRSGASLRPLLEAQASLLRRRKATECRLAAERLATTLLAPLGLCALPAFVLLGVVPAVLAVVSSTVV